MFKLSSENVKRSFLKCANVDCQVYIHKKCFDTFSKVFFIEKEWKCRSCFETKNISEVTTVHANSNYKAEIEILSKEIDCLIREKDLLNTLTKEREYIIDLQKKRINDLECKEFTSELFQAKTNTLLSSEQKDSRSYSSVVKTKVDNSKSCLIIKSSGRNEPNTAVENYFKNNFSPGTLGVEINKAKKTKDGFLISCTDEPSAKKLKETLESKLSTNYRVCEPTSLRPRFIIRGVPDECLKDEVTGAHKPSVCDDFVKNILQNNNLDANSVNDFKVISCFRNNSNINVIVEIIPSLFNYIINRRFLFLGWHKCLVEEYYQLIRCFKCSKYGHLKKDCRSVNTICPDCSDSHDKKDCKAQSKLCPNCKFQNLKHKCNWPTDHSANSRKCNFFKMKIDQLKNKTQYE